MMTRTLGLFSPTRKEPVTVDNHANCIFIALSVSVLDSLLTREHSQQTDTVIKALRRYYTMPDNNTQRLITPYQQIQQWIKEDTSALVHALAFILRQVTVDTWKKHPEKYIRAFLAPYESLSLEQMRQTGVRLDLYCSIAAIANTWNIPIVLREELPSRKGVPLRLDFQQNKYNAITNPSLVIFTQAENIASQIKNAPYFNTLSATKTIPWHTKAITYEDDTAQLFVTIKAEKNRCVSEFYHHQAHLRSVAEEQQLDEGDLTELYLAILKGFANSPTKPEGTERGHQKLCDQLCPNIPNQVSIDLPFEMQLRQTKIASIAQLASIGRLPSLISDYMDYREKGVLCEPTRSITTY